MNAKQAIRDVAQASNGDAANYVKTILLVIMIPWLVKLQISVSETAANRFTSKDGLTVWQKIGEIEGKIPTEVPPTWFLDRVDRLEARLMEIDRHLGDIDSRIQPP